MGSKKITRGVEFIRGSFAPSTFDKEKRTVDIIASTGARVVRQPFFSESFIEELEVSRKAVRLERFKNGAPLLDNHGVFSQKGVRATIGVIERAKIENKQIVTTVRFSEREDVQDIVRDVEAGIIRNASVGYTVHRMEEQKPEADGTRVMRATDWEPHELSLVTVNADAGAVTRSANDETDCTIITRSEDNEMDQDGAPDGVVEQTIPPVESPQVDETPQRSAPVVNIDEARAEAVKAERQRAAAIRASGKIANLKPEDVDDMIARGITVEQANAECLKRLAENQKEQNTRSAHITGGANLDREGFIRGIEGAVLHRMAPAKHTLDEQSKPYRYMRLLDLAAETLERKGVRCRGLHPMEIATRALHTTSDFPEILANVTNKTLRRAYEESPQTFAPFTRFVTVSDFKEISRTQLGDAPPLQKKLETGEYVHGTIGEAAEKYFVETYGSAVRVSRELLINDDLDAFSRLPVNFGRQARNLESDIIWNDVIVANPLMSDGNALFSAAHGNLTTGPGTALSVTSLGVARSLIRLQTSLNGSKLNLRPIWLYVPTAIETTADTIVTSTTPNNVSDVNPFGPAGSTPLTKGVEPRLDDDSATAWYLFADLGQVDILELARLEGEEGPVVESMVDFDTDGVKFKVRHTVGAKAIDHRGVYKNDGA